MSGSIRTLTTVVVVALSSWSCGSTAPEATRDVAAIVVSPSTSTIAPNAQLPLQAQVRDESGAIVSDADVTWTVQDPRIVSISEAGVVTALAVGTSQVAANSLGKFGIAIITVKPETVNPGTGNPGTTNPGTNDPGTSNPGPSNPGSVTPDAVAVVTVTAPSKKVKEGDTMQLVATATDAKGNPVPHQTFSWSSSNTSSATVSSSGVVTGKRKGKATITAQTSSSGGKSGSVELDVK
jgi:alpha-amylase